MRMAVQTAAARTAPRAALAVAAAAVVAGALAGCGELETPDLSRGNVAGRLVGGVPALAEVYPLGHPELLVRPDASGAFELAGLPAGPLELVVYDGTVRAERILVEVRGAERARLTLYGDLAVDPPAPRLALGGRVVAAVLPSGGGVALAPRVTALGTTRRDVTAAGSAVVVGVLPAGDYQLQAALAGYRDATVPITVVPGTSVHEVPVAPAASPAGQGCAAAGGQCANAQLVCDAADGRCYPCLTSADCAGGAACDPVQRFCVAPAAGGGGGAGPVCSVCTEDAQCAGGADAICHKPAGAGPGDPGYCTRLGTAAGPAGFALDAAASPARWVALFGCADFFEEFGEGCYRNATCSEQDGIAGGFCHRPSSDEDAPGHCTAPCATTEDCVVPGFTCQPLAAGGSACLRAPAGG